MRLSPLYASPMRRLAIFFVAALLACGPSQVETAQSPVQGMTRSAGSVDGGGGLGRSEFRRGDDGTVTAKLFAPAPAVWDAILAAMTQRHVTPSLLNRAVGRVGDTSMVLLHSWNGHQLSYFFNCGSTMTGPRADEERLHAILLAQMTRLPEDTIGVAVHFSSTAQAVNSGSSAQPSQCTSTGRGEVEFLDELIQRVGGTGKRM